MNPSISLIHQADYEPRAVYRAMRAAIDLLGGMGRFVSPGERILLKPNLLSPSPPEKAITTHPAVVRAAIDLVREAGGKPFIGDSPGLGSLIKAAERAGIREVAEQGGVELVEFDQPLEVKVPSNFRFKRVEVAQEALEADGIINLPKLKTHGQMTLSLGVKNLFGCVPGRRKAQWHFQAGVDRDLFAQMLLELYAILKPRLNILDGILGMEGDGPGNGGTPRWIGMVAASADGMALDRVIAELLGIPCVSVPTIKMAKEKGISRFEVAELQIQGESWEKMRVSAFLAPKSLDLSWGIPPFLRRALRGALTARPLIDSSQCVLCLVCSEACPAQAIQRRGDQLVIEQHGCIRCFCCQELCPEGAVKTQEGWAIRGLRIGKQRRK